LIRLCWIQPWANGRSSGCGLYADRGRKLRERVAGDVTELGKVEAIPRLEGRQMVMMINPVKH